MIRFDEVTVRYPRSAAPALIGVSMEALRSRVTAVAGPNGSGKTTLVRTLLRSPPVQSGTISIDGVPLQSMERRAVARRIAVVTQREEQVFPLPVRDYIALGRHPHGAAWSAASTSDDAAVARAISMAGVDDLTPRSTHELSGGEWQRVRIARALAQSGEALVLDEPNTFLDIAHEMGLFELLATLAGQGMTVLVVSHQLNLLARFADQLVLLHEGRVAAVGAPAEVMKLEILERVYDWPLAITNDPAVGAPSLVPLRRTHPTRT